MSYWLNLGQNLKVNAKKFPNTIAVKEKNRALTYPELNCRVNKLANSLLNAGLNKGDKVAVLLENSIEMVEIFLATAKSGLVIVPVNFRLSSGEIEYILNNSDTKLLILHDQFADKITQSNIPADHQVQVRDLNQHKGDLNQHKGDLNQHKGHKIEGYHSYEKFILHSPETEPDINVEPEDIWILIYTSGTTGKPKGVLRSHESHIAFYLFNTADFGFNEHDICMNVMPLCHINSIFYSFIFIYIGGTVYIHPAQSFRAEELLEIIEKEKISFISLIPTHYNLILNVPEYAKQFDRSSVRKLLCSSATVRRNMKLAIMDFFPGVELYEAYGSTEAGIVTILKPEFQMKKLGSIGFEALGTDFIKILDREGKEVKTGDVGELYSRSPMLFNEYYRMPEKSAASFMTYKNRGWFSAGDMARRDEDGFYYIVDRKDNMIITGGEHVYPSEVEEVIGNHPDVFDVAVVGLPDNKWGEKVTAVVIPKPDAELDETMITESCKDKIAGYKIPKKVIFIKPDEMPRTPTGKILHRVLRDNYNQYIGNL